MTLEQASKIIGCQPRYAVRNIHKALGLLSFLNSDEDWTRRKAAWLVLRNWKKHCSYQQDLRDNHLRYGVGESYSPSARTSTNPLGRHD